MQRWVDIVVLDVVVGGELLIESSDSNFVFFGCG